jgi:hypothetical protein
MHAGGKAGGERLRQRKAGPAGSVVVLRALLAALLSCMPAGTATSLPSATPTSQDLARRLESLHFGKYLTTPVLMPSHSEIDGWDEYTYPQDQLKCVTGFPFYIRARAGTASAKTALWLEGEGACWPGRDDCSKVAWFHPTIETSGLASPTKDNPARGWNLVYLPYCDGSLHMGDAEADYNGDGVIDHWHWGLNTNSAAVRLMQELFPDTDQVLIAGYSAGGTGTLAAPITRLLFPQADIEVLNVSGAGLFNPAMTGIPDLVKGNWNIDQLIPSDCPACNLQITYLYSWLLDRDTQLRVGLFSSYQDAALSAIWSMRPEDFESLLLGATDAIHAQHSTAFKRFFIDGCEHCLANYGYKAGGVTFWDWIDHSLKGDPAWHEVMG